MDYVFAGLQQLVQGRMITVFVGAGCKTCEHVKALLPRLDFHPLVLDVSDVSPVVLQRCGIRTLPTIVRTQTDPRDGDSPVAVMRSFSASAERCLDDIRRFAEW